MATIINNPQGSESPDSGVAMMVAIIVIILVVILFFVYALPAIRGNNTTQTPGGTNINVQIPPQNIRSSSPTGNTPGLGY